MMMKIVSGFITVTVIFASLSCTASSVHLTGEQIRREFRRTIKVTQEMQYLLYLPDDYSVKNESWPLLIFLHGAGERGMDIEKVKVHGPPKLIGEGHLFPFMVASPQCPDDQSWDVDLLDALLSNILKKYQIDERRIYLTGLSMGGFGTWLWASRYPDRFAAIAPICGGGDTGQICNVKNIPVWAFHGAKDNVVPVERSRGLVDALNKCGGEVRLTIYPEAGHDSWTETYDNPELYRWLLQHSR